VVIVMWPLHSTILFPEYPADIWLLAQPAVARR
jgi:hypothetical protein